jgi:hypothetical protein
MSSPRYMREPAHTQGPWRRGRSPRCRGCAGRRRRRTGRCSGRRVGEGERWRRCACRCRSSSSSLRGAARARRRWTRRGVSRGRRCRRCARPAVASPPRSRGRRSRSGSRRRSRAAALGSSAGGCAGGSAAATLGSNTAKSRGTARSRRGRSARGVVKERLDERQVHSGTFTRQATPNDRRCGTQSSALVRVMLRRSAMLADRGRATWAPRWWDAPQKGLEGASWGDRCRRAARWVYRHDPAAELLQGDLGAAQQ